MKKRIIFLLISAFSVCFAYAQTTWIGSVDNDFNNAANWSSNVPDAAGNTGTISSGTPELPTTNANANVNQSGGTVTITNATRTIYNGGTWNLTGGTFDIATKEWRLADATSQFVVNGGTFADTGGGGAIQIYTQGATFQFLSGTHNLSSTNVAQRFGTMLLDNGANASFASYNFGFNEVTADTQLTLSNGSSLSTSNLNYYPNHANNDIGQISFTGSGASSLTADDWVTAKAAYFNFDFASTSANSSITVLSNFFSQAEWETQWTNGKLTVDGANVGNFSDHFTVSGDTLTYVPEPGTYALGLSVLMLLYAGVRRRRR